MSLNFNTSPRCKAPLRRGVWGDVKTCLEDQLPYLNPPQENQ